jgi:predicted small integral membrane protein
VGHVRDPPGEGRHGGLDRLVRAAGRLQQRRRLQLQLRIRAPHAQHGHDLPDNALKGRAITSPSLWALVYWSIILAEAATGLVLAYGAFRLMCALRAPSAVFNAAKSYVVIGVGLGFLLWFTGFMVIGGEWFLMWQSRMWNGQQAAFRCYMTLLAVGIFVCLHDGELDP